AVACGIMLKRVSDILLASAGLVLTSPVLLVIAALVKLTSPGPVLYRGVRTGQYGVPFRILKFRSMIPDGERCGGTTTGRDDPRITRIGRVLRRYKLDELPQLINVLRGEMSFVGPRPEVSEYTDQYTPEQRKILDVRPGITDLASIEFSDLQEHVGGVAPDQVYREIVLPRKNQLRLKYANEASLWLDLVILARTLALVVRKPLIGRRSRPAVPVGPGQPEQRRAA
ncbi:MAG: sugar transferase, partial [Pirellulaceae bacterium]